MPLLFLLVLLSTSLVEVPLVVDASFVYSFHFRLKSKNGFEFFNYVEYNNKQGHQVDWFLLRKKFELLLNQTWMPNTCLQEKWWEKYK